MTFLAPGWIGVAAAMGAAVVVLHLLARRRPRPFSFPTARFVPDRPSTAASLAARPTDLPLLLLRLLLVFLLGFAFAQPLTSRPDGTTRIVLLDRSRLAPPLDSAATSVVRSADVVLAFDSVAKTIDPGIAASLPATGGRGSISAVFVAALRAAPDLAGQGDSLALTIISPFAAEEFDAATFAIRDQWKGGIALLPQEVRWDEREAGPTVLSPDDPLSATLALLPPGSRSQARLVRGQPNGMDSAWARGGGTLVLWPRVLAEMSWPVGPGDSIGGVAAGNQAVVAGFHRPFSPPAGTMAAAWSDGSAAATTVGLGAGCVRSVAIEVPSSGDLVLRPSFLALSRKLLSPCAGEVDTARVTASSLERLRGTPRKLASVAVAANPDRKTPANRWLLLAAALVFVAEPLVRRRRSAQ